MELVFEINQKLLFLLGANVFLDEKACIDAGAVF